MLRGSYVVEDQNQQLHNVTRAASSVEHQLSWAAGSTFEGFWMKLVPQLTCASVHCGWDTCFRSAHVLSYDQHRNHRSPKINRHIEVAAEKLRVDELVASAL